MAQLCITLTLVITYGTFVHGIHIAAAAERAGPEATVGTATGSKTSLDGASTAASSDVALITAASQRHLDCPHASAGCTSAHPAAAQLDPLCCQAAAGAAAAVTAAIATTSTSTSFDTASAQGATPGSDTIAPRTGSASTTTTLSRRALTQITVPSLASNGSASAAFPAAAFAAWCTADAACNASSGNFSLVLNHFTDAAPFTAATLNWPTVFSGPGVSGLQLVSGVVELQLSDFGAAFSKADQPICSTAAPCEAQLTVPLTAVADVTKSFVCLRLDPSIVGGSYQAVGYPPGSDGTSLAGIVLNGALRCNTSRFGRHIIVQYKQASLVPPSPPSSPPPPYPAPSPPVFNVTGVILSADVKLRVTVSLAQSFDALAANPPLLASLTSSLEAALAAGLREAAPALLLPLGTGGTGSLERISRLPGSPENAISVRFLLTVPAGATQSQVDALVQRLSANTTVFANSTYTSVFLSAATVERLDTGGGGGGGLGTGAVVGIAVGAAAWLLLAASVAYASARYRAYAAILPKKPREGQDDAYGLGPVRPRQGPRRRKDRPRHGGAGEEAEAIAADGAVGTGGGLAAPQWGAPASGGTGAGTGAGSATGAGMGPASGGVKSGAQLPQQQDSDWR